MELFGLTRRTLTTICFPLNEKGTFDSHILNAVSKMTQIHLSIRGSIRNMCAFKVVYQQIQNMLKDSVFVFRQCYGKNDFVISIETDGEGFSTLLRYYLNPKEFSAGQSEPTVNDACWEIHTDFEKAYDPGAEENYANQKAPTNVVMKPFCDFIGLKDDIIDFPWFHSMMELYSTHSNIDRNPVLHGPSYMVYKGLNIVNAYLKGVVNGVTKEKVKQLLYTSRTGILRYIRSWDQLTEQIIRNDDVLLSGRCNSHTIHFSLPESALEFYHAFLRNIVDYLITRKELSIDTAKVEQLKKSFRFVLCDQNTYADYLK
jgi:hypothetical protein